MKYTYYDDGRPKTIRGPYEIQNNIPWLIKYEYFNNRKVDVNGYVPWSKTVHYDPINNGNYFNTYVFVDGLGRTVQTKKNITYTNSQGQDVEALLVSGQVEYDSYNRPKKSYKPITEPLSACDTCFNTAYDTIQPTLVEYDVLDRKLQTTLPNNDINSVAYGFGNDAFGNLSFKTSITDANGITINSYTSAIGKQTTMQAPHQAVTKFKYNPLGELIQSIDPESNQTDYEYDDFGRLLSRDHPDAGTTEYEYDKSGNVLSIKTQNLINSSQQIDYNYYYNRIDSITYPDNPENNVYYKYGTPGSGNEANKIELMLDASGVTLFEYGKLGELTQQTKTNIMPLGDPYTFQINWEYDSWNRTKSITYPDGETVTFDYNNDGKPKSMEGVKGNDVFEYVSYIEYNKYGQRTEFGYGNDSRSEYTYEPYLNRMTNLKTWDGNQNKILDLDYTYDDVGNIEEIENTANPVSGLGGNYTYNYNYDSLYRLVNSSGSFTDNNSVNYPIELAMSYTPSGNISTKNLTTKTLIGGATKNISYRRSYTYNTSQPHTIDYTEVNNVPTYNSWDANGNMTRVTDNKSYTRNMCWDEENRLAVVKDNNYLSSYIYNAGGERTWKFTGEVERMTVNGRDYFDAVNINNKTLYQSPYMVVTNEQYTKHYFMGSQRVTSKIGGGMQENPVDPINEHIDPSPFNKDLSNIAEDLYTMMNRSFECAGQDPRNVNFDPEYPVIANAVQQNNSEEDLYFYHTDHLGSSSWITYTDGSVTQHLQNLPFGEPFIDQRATSYDIRFKFTGKEMDAETGYQYFGARYYDSDLSLWLSVDPLSDERLSISPFNYSSWSPIMRIDPDGMLDGWVENDGKVFWDKDVNSDFQAKTKYGDGAEHHDSYVTKQNGNIYNLNSDGTVDTDGGSAPTNREFDSNKKVNQFFNLEPVNIYAKSDNNTNSNNNKTYGYGHSFNVGFNIGEIGSQISFGTFGEGPGFNNEAFFSINFPNTENWFDFSASYQLLGGEIYNDNWTLKGYGESTGAGAYFVTGTFMTDRKYNPSYRIYGLGPSYGFRANGTSLNSKTFTFKYFRPVMFTPVSFKF